MPTVKHPSPKRVGPNIRTAREAKNMTQLALAHAMGWTGEDAGAQISRYENGSKEPTLGTLIKLAKALGTTLEKLTR